LVTLTLTLTLTLRSLIDQIVEPPAISGVR